jgi:hypothetical protein
MEAKSRGGILPDTIQKLASLRYKPTANIQLDRASSLSRPTITSFDVQNGFYTDETELFNQYKSQGRFVGDTDEPSAYHTNANATESYVTAPKKLADETLEFYDDIDADELFNEWLNSADQGEPQNNRQAVMDTESDRFLRGGVGKEVNDNNHGRREAQKFPDFEHTKDQHTPSETTSIYRNNGREEFFEEDDFDELDDQDLSELTTLVDTGAAFTAHGTPLSANKLVWNQPIEYKPAAASTIYTSPTVIPETPPRDTTSEQKYLTRPSPSVPTLHRSGQLLSPSTPRASTLRFTQSPLPSAIFRNNYPALVLDRSNIPGVSPNLHLRTCFRLGEALNIAAKRKHSATCTADENTVFELYARVLSSERKGNVQTFQLADLWSGGGRGVSITAIWDNWKANRYWDYNASTLLSSPFDSRNGEGEVARVVGRLFRHDKREWVMEIMCIWESSWEKVEWTRGIVCS